MDHDAYDLSGWANQALGYRGLETLRGAGILVLAACDLRRPSGDWWFVVVVEGWSLALAIKAQRAFKEADLPRHLRLALTTADPASLLGSAVLALDAARRHGRSYDLSDMNGHRFDAYRFYDLNRTIPAPEGSTALPGLLPNPR